MPNPATKPVITDEHKKKYEAIMGTQVKSNAPPPQTPQKQPAPASTKASSISSILASLPAPKGIGNKMFIFTGKKKIIMEGGKQEVEKIKTVDATQKDEKRNDAVTEHVEKAEDRKASIANVPTEVITKKEEPEKEKKKEKIKTASGEKKKLPTPVIAACVVLFIAAWALFWLVFFGYIKF